MVHFNSIICNKIKKTSDNNTIKHLSYILLKYFSVNTFFSQPKNKAKLCIGYLNFKNVHNM